MANKGRHAQKSHKGVVIFIVIILILAILGVGGYIYRDNVMDVYRSITGENTTTTTTAPVTTVPPATEPETTVPADPTMESINKIVADMTTEEKVCQLFVVTPEELTGVDVATVAGDTTKKMLNKYPVGGIVYFDQNKEDDKAFKTMVKKTKTFAKTPLFIIEDGENILKNDVFSASSDLKAAKAKNGSSAVKAFNDGAQILIMPKNLGKTITYFTTAVNSGQIEKESLDSAVAAILKAKVDEGIYKLA